MEKMKHKTIMLQEWKEKSKRSPPERKKRGGGRKKEKRGKEKRGKGRNPHSPILMTSTYHSCCSSGYDSKYDIYQFQKGRQLLSSSISQFFPPLTTPRGFRFVLWLGEVNFIAKSGKRGLWEIAFGVEKKKIFEKSQH